MELIKGTLVVAAQGNDFVVLGSDSLGMLGNLGGPIVVGSNRSRKITILSNHVAVAIFGAAEFGETLLNQFRASGDGVTNVLEEFRIFCREKWNEWFSGVDIKNQPLVGFMIAGLDQSESGEYDMPKKYSIVSSLNFAPALHTYPCACRGIPSLATFILNESYREEMSVDELCELVNSTISKVAQTDPRIGLPVRIALITPEEGARMVSD